MDAILTGYVQRREVEADQFMSLAWHVEAFRRSGKRFPKLEKVLINKPERDKRQQSNVEIIAAMDSWVAFQQELHGKKQ